MDNLVEKNKIEAVGKKSTRENLHSWIEQGFNDQAIAVYGASTRIFKRILSTGQLLPYPITLDYQRKLVEGDKYLYYALPIFERVAKVRPQLADDIVALHPHLDNSFELVKDELSADHAKEAARGYALRQSMIDSFYEKTGIKVEDEDDVYTLAIDIINMQFDSFVNETRKFNFSDVNDKESIKKQADLETINAIKTKLSRYQLAEVLSLCLQRRGVILYFNQEIFTGNKVLPGYEIEEEIMVVSDNQLTTNVISGIEVLSDSDLKELRNYL